MSKKRIVKDYEVLPEEVLVQVKMAYPEGFADNLIKYRDARGNAVSALPFDTDEIYYLIRMTVKEAIQIIEEDDDYDDEGNLKDEFIEEVEIDSVDVDEDMDIVDSDTEDTDDF